MKICLKTQEREEKPREVVVTIDSRLPPHMQKSCQLACEVEVEAGKMHYWLRLTVQGEVELCCQRCLEPFTYQYQQETQLAICQSEVIATQLMEHMDCMVTSGSQVDLKEILTDDLHLFLPEKHAEACSALSV